MGELVSATEAVNPIWALVFPFFPVLILLTFWAAAGGGFDDDDDDDTGGGKGIRVAQPVAVPSGSQMSVNTFFNSAWYPLMEFGFFVCVGVTGSSLGLL